MIPAEDPVTLSAGASLNISNVSIRGSGLGHIRGSPPRAGSLSSPPFSWTMQGVNLAQNSTLIVESSNVVLDCQTWWELHSLMCGQGYGPPGSMRVS